MNVRPEDYKQLLESPAFNAVWEHVENSLVRGMKNSAMGDLDTHHELVLCLQIAENFRKILGSMYSEDSVREFNAKMIKSVK